MEEKPKYLLVDSSVLPDVFYKVVYAKRLLAKGKARSSSEAAKMAGISRSAYYKYKDCVYPYESKMGDSIATFSATLEDEPGVLALLIAELYRVGANILTVNQNIPVDGVAPVTVSARTMGIVMTDDELLATLRSIPGVVDIRKLNSQ